MKNEKNIKKDEGRRYGCFPFLLAAFAVCIFVFMGKNGVKKDFNYLVRGEADIKKFFYEIKEAYEENMTYPDFSKPLSGSVTSPFGKRLHPIKGTEEMHTGIDIDIDNGADVKASADGEVVKRGADESYGDYIIIKHKGGFSTSYAHLDEIIRNEGEYVKKGESIGVAGSTGLVTGPHLHFEIRKGEERVDPMKYLISEKAIGEAEKK